MDNFDLKKYLVENKLGEDLPKDLEDKKQKVMNMLSKVQSQVDNLKEDKKSEVLKNRIDQLTRLMTKLEKEGNLDSLEGLLNYGLTNGVGNLLSKKFIDYALNTPENLVRFKGERLKRSIKRGDQAEDFTDLNLKFGQKTGQTMLDSPRGKFVKSIYDFIKNSNVDQSSKFALLDLIQDQQNLIPASAFETTGVKTGNLLNSVSKKIQKNKTYKQVGMSILKATSGRAIGGGEGFLMVFGKNVTPSQKGSETKGKLKPKNDINIDGFDLEVKASPGGQPFTIDDGSGNKGKGIDGTNKKYFPYLKTGSDFKIDDPDTVEFIKEKGIDYLVNYFQEVYPTFDKSDIDKISNIVFSNLGTSKNEFADLIKDVIFKYYKKDHNFDALLVIDPITGDYISVGSTNLPPQLVGTDWALTKGGDTQAAPDGFIRLSMR